LKRFAPAPAAATLIGVLVLSACSDDATGLEDGDPADIARVTVDRRPPRSS